MKALEPVALEVISADGRGRVSPYEDLLQQALSLNGLALPVECDNVGQARKLAITCQSPHGRGCVLGLKATQRANIVFLYRK